MMGCEVMYHATLPDRAEALLAPSGLATPHGTSRLCDVIGGTLHPVTETRTGQTAMRITPERSEITLVFDADTTSVAPYPEAMFQHRDTRFTRVADALVQQADEAAGTGSALERAQRIARATAERFTYGHPKDRFNDGLEAVPALGCGLTEGSCVDINTYFIAALLAVGLDAGYVTRFFFPEEKDNRCEDGHCWVVTRAGGDIQEWDIAHHLKLGTRQIAPGLNPKPGRRVGCFHSMGLRFPDLGLSEIKALIEPLWIANGQAYGFDAPVIRLRERARGCAHSARPLT